MHFCSDIQVVAVILAPLPGSFILNFCFRFLSFPFPSSPCLICGEGEIGDEEKNRVQLQLVFQPSVTEGTS